MRVALLLSVMMMGVVPGSLATGGDGCTRRDAEEVIRSFVLAYNRGDLRALNRLVAKEPRFHTYRVGLMEREVDASNRSTLIPYFKERRSHNDRLELLDLDGGRDISGQGWGMTFQLTRTTKDPVFLHAGSYQGKTNIYRCRIRAWNMNRG